MSKLRRGFKTEAETTAEQVRDELGIGNLRPFDPLRLADSLEIPVMPLSELSRVRSSVAGIDAAVELLLDTEQSALSAVTVFRRTVRVIVYNDSHELERRASDLAHELAHALLLHHPTTAFDHLGCRAWNTEIENEASYLGGALLIPGKGARWAAKSGLSLASIAARYGCTLQMAQWRLNESGGQRWIH